MAFEAIGEAQSDFNEWAQDQLQAVAYVFAVWVSWAPIILFNHYI